MPTSYRWSLYRWLSTVPFGCKSYTAQLTSNLGKQQRNPQSFKPTAQWRPQHLRQFLSTIHITQDDGGRAWRSRWTEPRDLSCFLQSRRLESQGLHRRLARVVRNTKVESSRPLLYKLLPPLKTTLIMSIEKLTVPTTPRCGKATREKQSDEKITLWRYEQKSIMTLFTSCLNRLLWHNCSIAPLEGQIWHHVNWLGMGFVHDIVRDFNKSERLSHCLHSTVLLRQCCV